MDNKQIKVTVIVPVYNTKQYLQKCVNSILGQTLPSLEILLIDDGSSDGCSSICDDYARSDHRVRVIHKENKGPGLARNIGIRLANGEYICFVDSDDWIEPEMYQTLYTAAKRNECDMVICDWTYQYLKTKTSCRYIQSKSLKKNHVYVTSEILEQLRPKFLLEEIHCSPCNKIYKAALLKNTNLDNAVGLTNMQDWVLNCEFIKQCNSLLYLDNPLYNYVIHAGGSLRGNYKDYFSIVLQLNKLRMKYLKDYSLEQNDGMQIACIARFMSMAKYAAFEYEFLFSDISFLGKMQRISCVVNNLEVRNCINKYKLSLDNPNMLCKVETFLIQKRMPLLIFAYVKCFKLAKKLKYIRKSQ